MSSHRERLTPQIEEALAVVDQIPDGPSLSISADLTAARVSFSMSSMTVEVGDEVVRRLVATWGVPSYQVSLASAVWEVAPGVKVAAVFASRYFPGAPPSDYVPVFRIPEAVTA